MHGEASRTEKVVLGLAENAVYERDPRPFLCSLPDLCSVAAVGARTCHRQLYVFTGKPSGPLHHVDDVGYALVLADASKAYDAQRVAGRGFRGSVRLVCSRRIEDRVVKVSVERGQTVVDVSRV